MIKDYIKALKNGSSYDFICDFGYNFNKSELINIIKELDYAIHSEAQYATKASDIYEEVARSLEELIEFEED